MSPWLTGVALPLTILMANIGAQIYFKWVPDIEEQKRQLKRFASWVFDIVTLAAQVYCFYFLARVKGPITGAFVVGVSLFAGLAVASFILALFRRIFRGEHIKDFFDILRLIAEVSDRHTESFRGLLSVIRRHAQETDRHGEAFAQLLKAPNLPAEIVESVQRILNRPYEPMEASPASPALESAERPKPLEHHGGANKLS
jgi:hypothetical protein